MNYIMTVINPDALKKLSDICAQLEIPMSVALHGRGTAIESMRDLLGIDSTEKWIVFSVAGEEKTKEYMNRLRRTLYIGVPGHGIAWAVPIKSVGGGKILAYLNDGRKEQKADIMRSIMTRAGADTDAGAVVFSVPVSEVAGFGMFDET